MLPVFTVQRSAQRGHEVPYPGLDLTTPKSRLSIENLQLTMSGRGKTWARLRLRGYAGEASRAPDAVLASFR